jgi:hypothetical protein
MAAVDVCRDDDGIGIVTAKSAASEIEVPIEPLALLIENRQPDRFHCVEPVAAVEQEQRRILLGLP